MQSPRVALGHVPSCEEGAALLCCNHMCPEPRGAPTAAGAAPGPPGSLACLTTCAALHLVLALWQ